MRLELIRSLGMWVMLLASLPSVAMPCWMQQPVTDSRTGFVGVASRFDAQGRLAVEYSRRDALAKMLAYLGQDQQNFKETDLSGDQVQLSGKSYYFAQDHIKDGSVFSYLSNQSDVEQCQPLRCRINRCSPAWLCRQDAKADIDVLGFADVHISGEQQWADAERSARQIASYWGMNDVVSELRLFNAAAAEQEFMVLERDIEVTPVNDEDDAATVMTLLEACEEQGRLYQRWRLPETKRKNRAVTDFQGIGVVTGYTASGSLRGSIDLAIKRAYANLAESRKSRVRTVQKNSQSDSGVNGIDLNAVAISVRDRFAADIVELTIKAERQQPYQVKATLAEK